MKYVLFLLLMASCTYPTEKKTTVHHLVAPSDERVEEQAWLLEQSKMEISMDRAIRAEFLTQYECDL